MKIKSLTFVLFTFLAAAKFNLSVAQNTDMKWAVGLGWNIVNDQGKGFPSFGNMMSVPFPSTIHGARFLGYGVTLDASVCYNKYVNGKVIHDSEANNVTNSNNLYFSFDANIKYDLHALWLQIHDHSSNTEGSSDNSSTDNKKSLFKYFDPYILFGYGYTYRAYISDRGHTDDLTNNIGLGFNIWVKDFLGVNVQGMEKFRMVNGVTNYCQFSAGIIYRFSCANSKK